VSLETLRKTAERHYQELVARQAAGEHVDSGQLKDNLREIGASIEDFEHAVQQVGARAESVRYALDHMQNRRFEVRSPAAAAADYALLGSFPGLESRLAELKTHAFREQPYFGSTPAIMPREEDDDRLAPPLGTFLEDLLRRIGPRSSGFRKSIEDYLTVKRKLGRVMAELAATEDLAGGLALFEKSIASLRERVGQRDGLIKQRDAFAAEVAQAEERARAAGERVAVDGTVPPATKSEPAAETAPEYVLRDGVPAGYRVPVLSHPAF
jgi:hypothetical protein